MVDWRRTDIISANKRSFLQVVTSMTSHKKPQQDESTQGLAPPRYGLKTFLGLVALVCGCLAAFVHFGALVGCAVLLALLVIIAHVAGNAIGTELRQRSDENSSLPMETGLGDDPRRRPHSSEFAPPTQLSHKAPLGWFMRIMTSLGVIGGAIAGGMFLVKTSEIPLPYSTIAFGCLAAGVLGGMFAFWLFSLAQVFLSAWWQAHWHGYKKHR